MNAWRRIRVRTVAARVRPNLLKAPWAWEQARDAEGIRRVYLRSPRGRRLEVQMQGGLHVRRPISAAAAGVKSAPSPA
jgi:hypothetical protein